MALSITKSTKFGINVTYWHIEGFEKLSYKFKQCSLILLGYATEQARLAGNAYLTSVRFEWNDDSFPFSYEDSDNVIAKSYITIKTIDGWTDAIDC